MNLFYKDEDCWLGWSEVNSTISLHTEIYSWSIEHYKKYLRIFADLLNLFKGIFLYSVAKTEKAKKFNEMFGLVVLQETDSVYIMGIQA